MSALLSKADIDRNELVAALPQLICEHAYLRMTKRAVAQLLARVFRNRPLRSFAKIARSAIDSKKRLFPELHKRLQVVGRYIGAFTIFTVALLLYAAPFLCALSASVYLALGINILAGGGIWLFIAILFGLMTFFAVYVLPYVQKPVSRATTTLINVASELF